MNLTYCAPDVLILPNPIQKILALNLQCLACYNRGLGLVLEKSLGQALRQHRVQLPLGLPGLDSVPALAPAPVTRDASQRRDVDVHPPTTDRT